MKNFERLNKNEMKMILGGTDPGVGGIDSCESECSTTNPCKEGFTCTKWTTGCTVPEVYLCSKNKD